MIYTELTKKAMKLCFEKHKDKVDKCGIPYPFHPFHVAESMDNEYSICVALLHDIIEDTDVTDKDLLDMGFPSVVVDAIQMMTYDDSVPYLDYVRLLKENEICRKVKLSDLRHNSDLTRLNNVTEKDFERIEKYKKAIKILSND